MIYFAQAKGSQYVKIGYTARSAEERLAELRTASPDLTLIGQALHGTRAQERWLHRRFQKWSVGGEWFLPMREILEAAEDPDQFLRDVDPGPSAAVRWQWAR